MRMEDEIEWNSSMVQDGVILGTMEYMYKKGHTLQEANYVLFDDTDNSYAPILKAMSSVNQTHPDILLKEMITKNPQAQQLQQQRILDAQAEANRLQAFEPQGRLDTYGRGIAQLISGYPGSSQVSQTPNLTPLQTALGVAATVGGLFGKPGT